MLSLGILMPISSDKPPPLGIIMGFPDSSPNPVSPVAVAHDTPICKSWLVHELYSFDSFPGFGPASPRNLLRPRLQDSTNGLRLHRNGLALWCSMYPSDRRDAGVQRVEDRVLEPLPHRPSRRTPRRAWSSRKAMKLQADSRWPLRPFRRPRVRKKSIEVEEP